jgi:hypothetical protein
MRPHLSLFVMALIVASASVASARALNPGAPLADIPSFTLTVPNFTTYQGKPISVTFNGTMVTKYAPAGPVPCPVSIEYDVKVSMTPSAYPPNFAVADPISYYWAPSKSLAGVYDVSNAYPGQALLNAPLVASALVTYKTSSPSEGSPVTFFVNLGGQNGKLELRVVSHVQCYILRAPVPLHSAAP